MEKKALKLTVKKPLKFKVKGKEEAKPVLSGEEISSTAEGITIIFKNAKIYADKVIIKRADEKG